MSTLQEPLCLPARILVPMNHFELQFSLEGSRTGIGWPKSPADPEIKYFSKVIPKMILDIGQLWAPPSAFFLVLENKRSIFCPCYAHLRHPTKACLRQTILQEFLKLFFQWLLGRLSQNCTARPVLQTVMFMVSVAPSEAIAIT